eukprot:TRINITY_DN56_c0_g1_i1.p1 TRINITY_DN56_c0_g1~~TRINITY_DN56_c0_g1_i1.p1  ORF type:complete len:638 (+),score=103.94 TRINITY_DN56_c0_g1_i1:78-1991(+)
MPHVLLFLCLLSAAIADWDACTSIAADRDATVEGSGIATHNNDCAQCDPRVAFIPAQDHAPGSLRPVAPINLAYPRFVGANRSSTYAPQEGQTDTKPLGFIGQVSHTYAYWEATYPLLNEHGLGFGESTCGGKLIGQSVADGGDALFSIAELMAVALERCKSSRCAIETMGKLGESHGFYGEDPGMPGAGESLSVVDPEETWVFHMTGGLKNKSATWVAQRVPRNHIAVVANNFIIQQVDCEDTRNFMCSPNIFSNAREANLCDFSEGNLNWLSCYGTDVRTFHYNPTLPPIPYYTTLRMWRIQSLANPKVAIALTDDPFAFSFSVPVARKVSRSEIMNWTRDYYKDTMYDMTQGVMAGPYNNPNRIEGGVGQLSVPGQFARGISIPRTAYSLVVESKTLSKAGQSIAWFATDQPLTSVFVPFIATSDLAASAYHTGRQEEFSRDSAWWAFNFVSNWMNINFKDMMAMHVSPAMRAEQDRIFEAVSTMEAEWPQSKTVVNKVQKELQENLVKTWWALADDLIVHFSDGMYTHKNTTKTALGYPAWWLQMIGFDNDFFKVQWVKFSLLPPSILLPSLPAVLQPVKAASSSFLMAARGSAPGEASFIPGLLVGVVIGAASASLLLRKPTRSEASVPLLA